MEKKKFTVLHPSRGFTLIEVLASIVILSTVAAGIFLFFTNAMKYTTYNQGKTVAVNVARGVLAYMERLDFTALQQYAQTDMATTNKPYTEINASNCRSSLFESEQVCQAILRPTINNVVYDETRLHVFVVPYNDVVQWDNFIQSPPAELPASLKKKLTEETIANSDVNLQKYLLKVYVIVRWGDDNDKAAWLEGVIANEAIR